MPSVGGHVDGTGATETVDFGSRRGAGRGRKSAGYVRALLSTIDVVKSISGSKIVLARCFQTHFGLRLREEECRRLLRRVALAYGINWDDPGGELACPAGCSVPVEDVVRGLAAGLADIAWRPLTPRQLHAVLNITPRERLRWTKDGRLRLFGRLPVRRGGVAFSVPTYPVSLAETLAASPAILAAWREKDAAR